MDPILELLNRLAAATSDEDRTAIQAELNAALAGLTDEELAEVRAALGEQITAADETRRAETTTREERARLVGQMQTLRDGILAATAEHERREAEQADLDAQAEQALADVTPPAEAPAEEAPAGEGAEAAPATPAEAPPAEQEQEPEAVAASATPRPRRVPLGTLARMQSPEQQPGTGDVPTGLALVASAGAPGIVGEGAVITDRDMLGRLMRERSRNLGSGNGGVADRVVVASAAIPRDSGHVLTTDPSVNADRLRAATAELEERARSFLAMTPEAMVAAGGFCGLTTPYYDRMNVARRGRPVRDGYTVSMQAPRAGIRFPQPFSLADIPVGNDPGDAVWRWDNERDIAALDGDEVKPCWHIECGEFTEELISAVGICIEYGNLGQRSYPELFAQATELADVAHDRVTESDLLDAIKGDSLHATVARALGAAKDFLAAIDMAAAAIRSRHRMTVGDVANEAPLLWTGPEWLVSAFRVDLVRTAFPGVTAWDLTAEAVMGWFRARRIVPTFYADSPAGAGQVFDVQPDNAALQQFPTHAEWGIALPGAHLDLDGGELNVGLVRGSPENAKNNSRVFSETFQGHAYVGPVGGSTWVRQELCADGSVAATVDTADICGVTGS